MNTEPFLRSRDWRVSFLKGGTGRGGKTGGFHKLPRRVCCIPGPTEAEILSRPGRCSCGDEQEQRQ